MIGKKINSSTDIPLYEVKELLKVRAEVEGEPTYEQGLTTEYVKKFSRLSKAKGEKIIKDLKAINGMTPEFAIKIADTLPDELDRLKLLVPKDVPIDDAALESILAIIKKYRK
ncbi:MAG: RNA polymerase Rpb4 family protein [Candidatus Diapherotrites archaeon]|nr:RNA polymerase Rpb4 family protein [Candidatus Micrarchaeota archaeon]MBU1940105.1 RNA polymerase Rpb4 family protein [Candidatus Micrarchaeota archaeon]